MPLVIRSSAKALLLELAKKRWADGKFTRVSADVYPALDAVVRKAAEELIQSHPSVGKTLHAGLRVGAPAVSLGRRTRARASPTMSQQTTEAPA